MAAPVFFILIPPQPYSSSSNFTLCCTGHLTTTCRPTFMSSLFEPRSYAPQTAQRIAFLGLGIMGYPMAGHLARAGHNVTVYNRNTSKALQWQGEFGGAIAHTPAEAAAQADIVMACVGNDNDLRAIFLGEQGALAGLQAGGLFIDHTTASADVARELYKQAQQHDIRFMDAPISGGQAGANKGKLSIMCGADSIDYDRALPLMLNYAQSCHRLGPIGSGQLCKMVNQIAVVGLLQSLAEAMAFGENAGLDMQQVLAVLNHGAARSWQMESKGPTMLARNFQPGFSVKWMRKDLDLVEKEAQNNGSVLPVTELVNAQFKQLEAQAADALDISSLFTLLQQP